jgi:hypothetical protein
MPQHAEQMTIAQHEVDKRKPDLLVIQLGKTS